MRIIGSVYNDARAYRKARETNEQTVVAGNLGSTLHGMINNEDHFAIRGSKDDPKGPFLKDGTLIEGAMFIGGGRELDWASRQEGQELTEVQFEAILAVYLSIKPEIVVSHEGPTLTIKGLIDPQPFISSQTSKYLQRLFEHHQPETWVFSHWETYATDILDGTEFISLEKGGLFEF